MIAPAPRRPITTFLAIYDPMSSCAMRVTSGRRGHPDLVFAMLTAAGAIAASRLASNHRLQIPRNPRSVLRQCHTGHSNAGRDAIEGLTKAVPVLDIHDGWQETNDYSGNCPGGRASCRRRNLVDCAAAFGVSGVFICVGLGTHAHGGICWAVSVRQLPP